MEYYKIQLIETAIALFLYLAIKFITQKLIEKATKRYNYSKPRVKITNKIINVILFFIFAGIILFIFGVDQSKLLYFISSLLTVVGIAFLAQWSILSNITATIIIFFSHPVKIGDTITVMDKDYDIEGRVSDIGIFFLIIKTKDGEQITMPSNVFTQKMIKKKINEAAK